MEQQKQLGINAAGVSSINVNIDIIKKPLVIFFGPPDCGKTVALLRLSKYLGKGVVDPEISFRNDNDFKTTLESFNKIRSNDTLTPESTGHVNFLLLRVTLNSNPYCYILEAPGEHYFNNDSPDFGKYELYLNQIFSSDYRKVFVIFFEEKMFHDPYIYLIIAKEFNLLLTGWLQQKHQ